MIWLYRFIWLTLLPIIFIWFVLRLTKGKEDKNRFMERFGFSKIKRPQGQLIWFHCASVGESLSILPLIETLLSEEQKPHILLTTGTTSSAKIMKKSLPKGVIHQYVPIDFWPFVALFNKKWQADLTVFLESEFWPEMLHQATHPWLINARMSDRSAKRYQKLGFLMKPFLKRFEASLCQTELDAERLARLDMKNISLSGNLKFDAAPLHAEESELQTFKSALSNRPVFLCASTHPTEELLLSATIAQLRLTYPNLLTLIVPRHAERGTSIAEELSKLGMKSKQRSKGELPDLDIDVYIGDSMGEMGLYYQIADIVFVGGSLIPHGGQNPLEPLKLGKITLCGPYMHNFRKMMHILEERGIVHQLQTLEDLEKVSAALLKNPRAMKQKEKDILDKMNGLGGATEFTARKINEFLTTQRK